MTRATGREIAMAATFMIKLVMIMTKKAMLITKTNQLASWNMISQLTASQLAAPVCHRQLPMLMAPAKSRMMFQKANWFVFVMSIAFFVMIMTNFIMNVAAIAISLPVALVIAPYLGVAGEVILFAALVTAGMPFLLLVGAAPNAIAYDSGQFTPGEFLLYGIPASILLMLVTAFAVFVLWPLMGMPVLISG